MGNFGLLSTMFISFIYPHIISSISPIPSSTFPPPLTFSRLLFYPTILSSTLPPLFFSNRFSSLAPSSRFALLNLKSQARFHGSGPRRPVHNTREKTRKLAVMFFFSFSIYYERAFS